MKMLKTGLIILLSLKTIFSLECSSFKAENIKVITFDVYAALMSTANSLKSNVKEIFPKTVEKNIVDEFINCWVQFYGGAMYADVSKYDEPFENFLMEGINHCTGKLHLTNVINEELKENLILSWTSLEPWPETVDALKIIKTHGIKIGILSNGSVKSLKALIKNSLPSIEFDYVFGSTVPKVFKPKMEMYRQVETTLLGLNQILHIAGADMDVEGARAYGLFAGHNQKQSGEVDFKDPFKPCFTIANLSELPGILFNKAQFKFLE